MFQGINKCLDKQFLMLLFCPLSARFVTAPGVRAEAADERGQRLLSVGDGRHVRAHSGGSTVFPFSGSLKGSHCARITLLQPAH